MHKIDNWPQYSIYIASVILNHKYTYKEHDCINQIYTNDLVTFRHNCSFRLNKSEPLISERLFGINISVKFKKVF